MTIEEDYRELIYAFAFGCLDLDEYSKFLDYLTTDTNFNWNELGEYQNLAALLPSILTIENPDAGVKAKVAKKLYSFKDEIRAKKKKLTIETAENVSDLKEPVVNIEPEKPEPSIVEHKEEIVKENIKIDNEEVEVVAPERKTEEIFRPSQATQLRGRDIKSFLNKIKKTEEKSSAPQKEASEEEKIILPREEIKLEEEKPADKEKVVVEEKTEKSKKSPYVPYRERRAYAESKNKNYSPIIFLLFILMAIGFLWLYFSTSSQTSKLQQEINKLTYQISTLSTSFKKNNDLQEILTTKNVVVVNLVPTRLGNKGYGKLIISFDKNKGFFQMFNMPELEKSKSYQLWVNVSRSYFSLGIFPPNENSDYYPFKLPQLSGKQTIRFLVSKETKLGAERPGKLIYLKGKL